MSVVHPSLFPIMQRFPDLKDALRHLYLRSESFQAACNDYQKCSEALCYWSQSSHKQAPNRQQEYAQLLKELEEEILQSLQESGQTNSG